MAERSWQYMSVAVRVLKRNKGTIARMLEGESLTLPISELDSAGAQGWEAVSFVPFNGAKDLGLAGWVLMKRPAHSGE